jgi:hypothetical protein
MTIISGAKKVEIDTLRREGYGYKLISKKVGGNANTGKSYLRDDSRNGKLPPKEKRYRGYFQGRIPGLIRRQLEDNPLADGFQIIAA